MSTAKIFSSIAVTMAMSLLLCGTSKAQDESAAVFIPIAKYIEQGDAESLSAWFADSVEMDVDRCSGDASRKQAQQIVRNFFSKHRPSSFEIMHTASRANMKYALGQLNAGGERFDVTIFVGYQSEGYRVQHLKIEKSR